MAQVITLEDYVPAARFDSIPWTQARIEEGATIDGAFTAIQTIAISPVDADPSTPAARSFTTNMASETPNLWYRIVFLDASGNDTLPTAAIQNGSTSEPYATVEELAQLLKVNATTRRAALQRVLDTAAYEIDQEIGRSTSLSATQLQLAAQVNLERAVEHWQQEQSPFGVIGLGGESGPAFVGRDTWDRHAHKLAPLKQSWGVA